MDNFAVFILTHGRAKNVKTYRTLRKQGYTGKIYLLIDTDDKQGAIYKKKYGKEVVVFDKKDYEGKFDVGDNFNDKSAVVYARNACFDVAEKLGCKTFMEFDDDYEAFEFRLYEYGTPKKVHNLDGVFNVMLRYYESIAAVDMSMAQGGDFIGGKQNNFATNPKLRRKCMNTHILSTKRRFDFMGKINEDVNSPICLGSRGSLFLTVPLLSVVQTTTQANDGGLTDIYLDRGTYVKSFYSVMFHPSSCTVAPMGDKHMRLHHRVSWNNAIPLILPESAKKKAQLTPPKK